MAAQPLHLQLFSDVDGTDDFRLDAHTREIGRQGVAEARRVLTALVQAAAERESRRQEQAA